MSPRPLDREPRFCAWPSRNVAMAGVPVAITGNPGLDVDGIY